MVESFRRQTLVACSIGTCSLVEWGPGKIIEGSRVLMYCNDTNPQATEEFHLALLKDHVLLDKVD